MGRVEPALLRERPAGRAEEVPFIVTVISTTTVSGILTEWKYNCEGLSRQIADAGRGITFINGVSVVVVIAVTNRPVNRL